MTTVKRELEENGFLMKSCEILGCNFQGETVDIHHIFPKAHFRMVGIDPNVKENLISLCPNHHRQARGFNWKSLKAKELRTWKEKFVSFILEKTSV
jgi:hypothetical protein